jgi:hypothetical protein
MPAGIGSACERFPVRMEMTEGAFLCGDAGEVRRVLRVPLSALVVFYVRNVLNMPIINDHTRFFSSVTRALFLSSSSATARIISSSASWTSAYLRVPLSALVVFYVRNVLNMPIINDHTRFFSSMTRALFLSSSVATARVISSSASWTSALSSQSTFFAKRLAFCCLF